MHTQDFEQISAVLEAADKATSVIRYALGNFNDFYFIFYIDKFDRSDDFYANQMLLETKNIFSKPLSLEIEGMHRGQPLGDHPGCLSISGLMTWGEVENVIFRLVSRYTILRPRFNKIKAYIISADISTIAHIYDRRGMDIISTAQPILYNVAGQFSADIMEVRGLSG